jgi:hypothetical protein
MSEQELLVPALHLRAEVQLRRRLRVQRPRTPLITVDRKLRPFGPIRAELPGLLLSAAAAQS